MVKIWKSPAQCAAQRRCGRPCGDQSGKLSQTLVSLVDGLVGQVHDPQAQAFGPDGAVDDALAVRREGGKGVVVGAGGQLAIAAAVGIEHARPGRRH